eukprot:TCALIF_12476-PA protein Name:"Protein of unknown function" AED:0.27 eAED:0.32 QI:85/0/0.5/1/0/0.5/2/1325/58
MAHRSFLDHRFRRESRSCQTTTTPPDPHRGSWSVPSRETRSEPGNLHVRLIILRIVVP